MLSLRALPKLLCVIAAASLACQMGPAVATPIGQAPLTAPALLSPAAEATVGIANPTFTWEAVSGATYYLVTITQDGTSASRQIVTGTSTGTSYVASRALIPGTGYTWMVTAANDAGSTAVAAARHFMMDTVLRPGAPILDNLDGRAVSNGENLSSSRAGLHWHPRAMLVSGQFYEIQFNYADSVELMHTRVNGYEVQGDRSLTIYLTDTGYSGYRDLGVNCGETYQWRVRVMGNEPHVTADTGVVGGFSTAAAINRQAAIRTGSDWSETWTFRVPPRVTAAPSLRAPAESAVIRGGRLSWSGPANDLPLFYEYELINVGGARPSQIGYAWGGATSTLPLEAGATPGTPSTGLQLVTGQTYNWRVRTTAVPNICWGPWSASRSFVWQGPNIAGGPAGELVPGAVPCLVPACPSATPGPSPTATLPPTRTPRRSATPAVIISPLAPVETAITRPPATAVPSATIPAPPPSLTPTAIPQHTHVPSDTPKPTDTLLPSDTPKPTDTPLPEKPTATETLKPP